MKYPQDFRLAHHRTVTRLLRVACYSAVRRSRTHIGPGQTLVSLPIFVRAVQAAARRCAKTRQRCGRKKFDHFLRSCLFEKTQHIMDSATGKVGKLGSRHRLSLPNCARQVRRRSKVPRCHRYSTVLPSPWVFTLSICVCRVRS